MYEKLTKEILIKHLNFHVVAAVVNKSMLKMYHLKSQNKKLHLYKFYHKQHPRNLNLLTLSLPSKNVHSNF